MRALRAAGARNICVVVLELRGFSWDKERPGKTLQIIKVDYRAVKFCEGRTSLEFF
jgi:hypothetical protein